MSRKKEWSDGHIIGALKGDSVVYRTWDQDGTDRDGSPITDTYEGVEWRGERVVVRDHWGGALHWRSVDLALQHQVSFEQAMELEEQERLAKIKAARLEKERREKQARLELRERLANPQTPEDKKRKQELLDILRQYGSYFASTQPPHGPHALPYLYADSRDEEARLLGLITEEEAEVMGVHRGYIHDGQFPCPFCGELVKKNEPCEACCSRVATDYEYNDLKNLQWDPFKENWADVVKKYWRLRQYQCSCGLWVDTPVCPDCQSQQELEQGLAKFRSATRGWVGKRVRVEIVLPRIEEHRPEEIISGPITLCDTATEIRAEERKRENDWDSIQYTLLMKFSSGSFLKAHFYRVLVNKPDLVELEWEFGGGYTPEKHLRLTLIGGEG